MKRCFPRLSDAHLLKYEVEAHGNIRSPIERPDVRVPCGDLIAMIEELRAYRLSGATIDPIAAELASTTSE